MKNTSVFALISIATLALACEPTPPTPPAGPEPVAPSTAAAKPAEASPHAGHGKGGPAGPVTEPKDGHYGKAFTLTDTEPLAAALASVGDEAKKVRVSGEVDAVCQAKGCWLVLKDGDQSVRIFTKGHAFFLPTTIKGRKAEAEGTVKARTHSKAFAKHLAEDSGEDPAKVDAPKKEFVMDASSVKVLPSS